MKQIPEYKFQQRRKRDLKRLWYQLKRERRERNMFRTTQKPNLIKTGLEGVHYLLDDPAILRSPDFRVSDVEDLGIFVFKSHYLRSFLRDHVSIDLIGHLDEI